jgi:protein-glucosylgalactosylhydroxylysine glucosidase
VEDRHATVSGPPFTLYHDHPCVLMICGWLPPEKGFDMARFGRTYEDIAKKWDYPTTWGWDPPVMAMAAARLDRPSAAIDELLRDTPRNGYLANGHNYLDQRLPLYLPGNGGLLQAVAMMAAGWDGAPDRPSPGFPTDGTWKVRSEGLIKAP